MARVVHDIAINSNYSPFVGDKEGMRGTDIGSVENGDARLATDKV